MDNPETLPSLDTHDTGRGQRIYKNTIQKTKYMGIYYKISLKIPKR
jgi:hypothetical protein